VNSQNYDVIVCGAGPAGIGAAVAAARAGAKTLLIERLAHVGGMHTSAGVINWCDTPGGPIFDEIYEKMNALGAASYRMDHDHFVAPGRANMDTELTKVVALEMIHEAGADVLFLAFVESAILEGNRVVGINVVSKSGRTPLRARTIIDATADADVAAAAGAAFRLGDPNDGRLQHCNFRVWYDNIDGETFRREKPSDETLIALFKKAHADGDITPPDHLFQPEHDTFPFNLRYNTIQLSAWEFENVDPLDALAMSRVLTQCQVAVLQIVRFFRQHIPGHEKMSIRKLPSSMGLRESRRIVGRYELTADDVRSARKFDDGIARACFYMDLHDSPPGITIPHPREYVWANRPPNGETYEIPFRCLIPEKLASLLVVGRSISTDRLAHGSTRAMPTCLYTGHAAGLAAALAAEHNITADQVNPAEIRPCLGLLVTESTG